MGDILNFDPNRKLQFDPNRELGFSPGRELLFHPGRGLLFNPNRDLGFGRRGVVFRGYICPICGALVSPDATKCNECGAVFEGRPRASQPTPPREPEAPMAKPPSKPPATVPTAPLANRDLPAARAYCAYCGVKLHAGDAFCWNCGARAVGTAEVVGLPPRKSESVTRDWRGPQER